MLIKKILFRILLITIFSSCLLVNVNAQGPGDPGDGDPEQVPLDPGSWVLVAAGVGYGVKKWKENKQQNKADSEAENEIIK